MSSENQGSHLLKSISHIIAQWEQNAIPKCRKNRKRARLLTRPRLLLLAAAAVIVAATATTVATIVEQTAATAVAEQNDDQNDPANITAAETVIVTHNSYLRNILR
jgi:hypothetical protein